MRSFVTSSVRSAFDAVGYEVKRKRRPGEHDIKQVKSDRSVFDDLGPLLAPTIFDVGANIGQTIDDVLAVYPGATVHSFEPGAVFHQLSTTHSKLAHLNNAALGAQVGTLPFYENTQAVMSSFLKLDTGWGEQKKATPVPVDTLDRYCEAHGVQSIDLLKSDTQGFDLEVLKGATRMLNERRIKAVFLEINFANLYKDQPGLNEIYRFLAARGFDLVSFYDFYYHNDRPGWTDALFKLT